jgi:hypothetical protein
MTEEMLALALENQQKAGATNVEFLKGTIEAIPLPANTIDVVISNCVINLSTDKPAVFAEMIRVLNPGGRIGISDVVADDTLTPDQRAERGDYVGCIAGALSFAEYRQASKPPGSPTSNSAPPTRSPTACTPPSSAPRSPPPATRLRRARAATPAEASPRAALPLNRPTTRTARSPRPRAHPAATAADSTRVRHLTSGWPPVAPESDTNALLNGTSDPALIQLKETRPARDTPTARTTRASKASSRNAAPSPIGPAAPGDGRRSGMPRLSMPT